MGIDGHSRVRGYQWPTGGCLPFLIEVEGDRFIALQSNHTAFVADGFPYLTRIDGRPIQQWIDQAATRVPKGAPHWIRHRCVVRFLGRLDYWRKELGLPRKQTVRVELTDATGQHTRVVELPVAKAPFSYPIWPQQPSRLLNNNIGYLRLPTMEKEPSLKEITTWMPQFRNASGLIVDVRDNDGGDRAALLWLYSYLASPTAPPHVFTAAAYRLHVSRNENHLAGGPFMFREDDAQWSPAERLAIEGFKKRFKPEWELPVGQFSPWHYLALRSRVDASIYHFDKPVVVLMNAKCFSACDIFLAGLKGVKNVTLLGTPSGGGSGNSESFILGATPIRLTLSTMASFQANGRLFDGHGVQPDIVLEAEPAYYIGGSDRVLEKAVSLLKASQNK
ncbi:hypothetical protein GO755_28495 [Spirosoma sp. HMF4905]|uniref:Tail specific protease domain-containing protein n=1 Tax=Spirosoma arboris TaxID=2682092 RepID=A0A7K1SJM1_9BACT|nr:S41 family peptidase [Spirosoma arboris]MVM34007.1 hypothetical protein [Spirosoma arboris]